MPIPAPVQREAEVRVRPIVMLKSSTASVVVFNVVVVPLTVKSPVTVTLPAKVAVLEALPIFNAVDAFPCGSVSITKICNPCFANAAAKLTAVVVLPTPPF